MKKILYPFILFLLIFAVAGCSSVDKGVTAQGVKGRIVIYTSMYEYVIQSVRRDLKNHFPDQIIDFVYGGTGHIQARIASEKASGRLGCDMLMVAEPAYSLELKEQEMLHHFKSKEADNLAFEYDKEGYWYPVRVSNMVLAYNPDRYTYVSLPHSFYDFANNTNLKGKISMRNPLTSGTSMAAVSALRDKYGYEYFGSLSKQNINIDYNAETPILKLETGEYAVAMILEESILRRRQEGSKLEVIYPTDGTVMIPSTIMIINNKWNANRNIPTAEAITDWFLSEVGQTSIVNGWMHSVRSNFSRIPYDSKPTSEIRANSIAVNWENNLHQKKEIQDRFQDYLAARD